MKGFKMLNKKRRERICNEAIGNAIKKYKLDDLVEMCEEHKDEDPLLEDLKNILTGTNIKITGVGYNDADEVLFKLEMVINGKSVASLNNILDEFNAFMPD